MARILFFGKLADLAGGRERKMLLSESISTINGLIDEIGKADEVLAAALREVSVRCIVNEEMNFTGRISDQDEIAFLPPVSGG